MRLSLKYFFVSLTFSVQLTIADQTPTYVPTADQVVQPKSFSNTQPTSTTQTLPAYVPTADQVIQPKTIASASPAKTNPSLPAYIPTADQVVQPAAQKNIVAAKKTTQVANYVATADRVVQPSSINSTPAANHATAAPVDYVATADRVVQPTTTSKTIAVKNILPAVYVATADRVVQPQNISVAAAKTVVREPSYIPTADRVIQPANPKVLVAAKTATVNLAAYVPTADRVVQPSSNQVMQVAVNKTAPIPAYIPTADRVIQPLHPLAVNHTSASQVTLPTYVPTADRVIQPPAAQLAHTVATASAPALPAYIPTADRVIQPANVPVRVAAAPATSQLPAYIPTADRVVQPSAAVIAASYKAPVVPVYVPKQTAVKHYTEIDKIAPEPVFTPLPVFVATSEQVKQPATQNIPVAAKTTTAPPAKPKAPQPKKPIPALVAIPTREPRIQVPANQTKITTLTKEAPPKSANHSIIKKPAANVAVLAPAKQAVGSETPVALTTAPVNKPIVNQASVAETTSESLGPPPLLTPEVLAPAAITVPRLNANTVTPTSITAVAIDVEPPALLTPMPKPILPIPVPLLDANVIAPFPVKATSQAVSSATPINSEVPILLTPMPKAATAIFVPEINANTVAPISEKVVAVTATPKVAVTNKPKPEAASAQEAPPVSTSVHSSVSLSVTPSTAPKIIAAPTSIEPKVSAPVSLNPSISTSVAPTTTANKTSATSTEPETAPVSSSASLSTSVSAAPIKAAAPQTEIPTSTATPTASVSTAAQETVTTQQVDAMIPATQTVNAANTKAVTPAPAVNQTDDTDTNVIGPAIPDNFVQTAPLQPLSIGFDAQDGQGNELFSSFFYNVLSDDNQTPYVSVNQIFNKLLGYDLKGCEGTFSQCDIVSKPPGIELLINAPDNSASITRNGKTYTYRFAPGTLKVQDNDLWVREDIWPNLIPMKVKWDPSYNQLSFVLNVPVYQILQAQRAAYNQSIIEQQTLNQEYQQSLQQYTQKPTKPVNAQLRYQFTDNEALSGTDAQTNRSLSYNFLGDILTGTFTSSGTVWSQPSSNSNNLSWNYAFNQRPYIYSLQFGDVSTNASPFTGQVQLLNGLLYQKEQSSQTNMTFNYTGQALPGTQIDVWRGDYLVKMLTVPASGTFSVNDPNSQPGDSYRFEYYYPNGSHETKTVLFPASQSFLLNQKQWDAQLYTGQATQGVGVPGVGNFTQSLFRYGVFDNVTAGIGNYVVPSINGSTGSTETYFDLAWQLTPYIYAEASKMLSTSGYALQGTISTSDNNTVQWYYDILDADNPLLQLPVSYTPLYTQSNAYKNFAVQDTYTLNRWRLLANYVNTNLQTQTQFGGSTYYNQYISPSITFGTIQPKGGNTNLQTNIYNTSALSAASIVQTFATISAGSNTYGGSYSYQPYGAKYNFNLSYSYSASTSPSSTYGLGVNYNLNKNWFLSSNVSSNSVTVGINFADMVTLFSKTTDPGNFSTGTVYGKLLAPKIPGEDTQQPLSGVEISVGGQTAVTDAEGNYVITGVSTGTEQYLKINANTLDASYVPALDEVPLKFRPGTVIQYNPVLNETAGLDGYLMTSESIPAGAMIVAKRQDNSGFYRVAKVSPDDGSFEFYTLTPGTYSLEVEGVDNPPAPIKAVISPEKDWLSNVLIYWKMPKVADKSGDTATQ